MPKKAATRVIYRDAGTGEIVTKAYAEKHPKTTTKEHRPAPRSTGRSTSRKTSR